VVHEYLSHEARRHTQEVPAILKVSRTLAREAQIRFVHQSRALQGVSTPLPTQVVVGEPMQLAVEEGYQSVERGRIARLPLGEQRRHIS